MSDRSIQIVQSPVDVVIVEDRRETADRLARAVSQLTQVRTCSIARSVREGLFELFQVRPRAILVDLGLPDGSGVEIIRAAQAADWLCDSLVVTVFADEDRVIEAIAAGATGYILKNDRPDEIGRNLVTVLEGGSPISPQIARHLLNIVPLPEDLKGEGLQIRLTAREKSILRLIAHGFKRQEVAEKLNITIGTVGTHINNVYRKLEVSSNTQAVATANRLGLF